MNGRSSSRNQPTPTRGATGGQIPTLRIQAGTPLPPSSTRATPVPGNGSQEGSPRLPQITNSQSVVQTGGQDDSQNGSQHVFRPPAPPRPLPNHGSSDHGVLNRPIKQDGFGPQCIGLNVSQSQQQSHTPQHNYNAHQVMVHQNRLHFGGGQRQMRIPNHVFQNQSPTPSDVSSIRLSRNQVNTPASIASTERNGVTTPRSPGSSTSEKPVFLEPGMPVSVRQDWCNNYKPLPGIGNHSDYGGDHPPHSALSHYASSNNSLSPFPQFPDLPSPSGSSFASPRTSARSTKKRALSISPLSAEGLDIMDRIRTSPTSLVAYINGSRSPSTIASPMPNSGFMGHMGTFGHTISARNSSGSPSCSMVSSQRIMTPQSTVSVPTNQYIKQEEDVMGTAENMSYYMGNLEQSGMDTSQNDMQNQMVMPMNQSIMHTFTSKTEPPDNGYYVQQPPMPPTNMKPPPAPNSVLQHPPMKPPPSYESTIERRMTSKYNGSTNSETGDSEDGDNTQHICKWIDCNTIFQERDDLVRHIEKVHIDQRRGEDFTCFWQACQRRHKPFNARYKLLIHMRVHSGEKPNKCTFEGCNKAFSRLENLKIHLRSHTGERPYLCQYQNCTKAFSNSSDRAKHQRTHQDTKPYACQIPGCTKRYTDPSSLRKHVKNHSQKEQQARKKMRSAGSADFSTDSLIDCLTIHQIGSRESPLEHTDSGIGRWSSYGSLPGSSGTQYSSTHSSRSGTANFSNHPSPISMHGSPMAPPMSAGEERMTGGFSPAMASPRGPQSLMSQPQPMDMDHSMTGDMLQQSLPAGSALNPHSKLPAINGGQQFQDQYQQSQTQQQFQEYGQQQQMSMQNGGAQFPTSYQNNTQPTANMNISMRMMRQPSPRNMLPIPKFEDTIASLALDQIPRTNSVYGDMGNQGGYDAMVTGPEENSQFLQHNAVERCYSRLSAVYADGSS